MTNGRHRERLSFHFSHHLFELLDPLGGVFPESLHLADLGIQGFLSDQQLAATRIGKP